MLRQIFWANFANTMAADALDLCVAKPSVAMTLIGCSENILVFPDFKFQELVTLILQNISLGTHCEIVLRWMLQNLTDEKLTWFNTWGNVDPVLCRHTASLGHNEFIEVHSSYLVSIFRVSY